MHISGKPRNPFDCLALLLGCGVLGAGTGLVLGLALLLCAQLFAINFFGLAAIKFCLAYLPVSFGCASALGGLLFPDRTSDALASVWHLVVALFAWS
jgi:hypothetical protein